MALTSFTPKITHCGENYLLSLSDATKSPDGMVRNQNKTEALIKLENHGIRSKTSESENQKTRNKKRKTLQTSVNET